MAKTTKILNLKLELNYEIKNKELPDDHADLEQLFYKKVSTIIQSSVTVFGKLSTMKGEVTKKIIEEEVEKEIKEKTQLDIFWELKLAK